MTARRSEWPALIKFRHAAPSENAPLAVMLEQLGSAEAALTAGAEVWRALCGHCPKPERLGPEADRRAEEAARTLEGLGGAVIDVRQPEYPAALRRLHQPPPVLFVLGRHELLNRPSIAVVGTRRYSTYGRDATVSFGVGLVRAGYVIVSGLARGIDSVAHRTALDVGGETVGVLGTGLDVVYPPENEELMEAVARRGCLVSEFAPGTPPRKHHFPQRNRIITGLSRAVLVVEAAERSGALITARLALEEGKEVFAVPGPIHNPTSMGTNRLIQDGAALVVTVADILQALESRTGEPLPEPLRAGLDAEALARRLRNEPDPRSSELVRRVWELLQDGARDVDTLARDLAVTPGALSAALMELELAGLVEKLAGPRYVAATPRNAAAGPL